MKKYKKHILKDNLIEQCKLANPANRAIASTEKHYDFDCNIQQMKQKNLNVLYYELFFADRIAIFRMDSSELKSCAGYSDFQHKGNKGEGQFHINRNILDYHF